MYHNACAQLAEHFLREVQQKLGQTHNDEPIRNREAIKSLCVIYEALGDAIIVMIVISLR